MNLSFLTKNTNKKPNPNYVPPTIKNNDDSDNFDIDIEIARRNYEAYQNDLTKRQQAVIKRWNKEIAEASRKGEKFFITNRFITDKDDKDKIMFMIDRANCTVDLPSDATVAHFYNYYENKGFKVVRLDYQNNICCLKIIWMPQITNNF